MDLKRKNDKSLKKKILGKQELENKNSILTKKGVTRGENVEDSNYQYTFGLLAIFGLLILGAFLFSNSNQSSETKAQKSTGKPVIMKPIVNKPPSSNLKKYYPVPKSGFSPYDEYFGKGIYDNSSGNDFLIKNSNSTDAVVLLVNAFTERKVRNEFIRRGEEFKMTGVPNGTYYLEWQSGKDWSPYIKVGNLTGGFQTNATFTKTDKVENWMKADGYVEWSITLYSIPGGNVESESMSSYEFGN